jgi:hypothetical protein
MRRYWIAITLIVLSALAFTARVATDIHFKAWKSPAAMEHKSIAQALVNGNGFRFGDWNYYGPTSVQSPPFPFLLAGMFKLFHAVGPDGQFVTLETPRYGPHGQVIGVIKETPGLDHSYMAIMFLNALAGAGLVWLTYLMTRIFGGTPLAGLIAAALVAFWPSQIYAARFVQAVSLITTGLVGMICLYYIAVRSGKMGPWIGYSFLACVVTLTEPVFLPALILSGGLMLITRQLSLENKLRNVAILGFAIVAVIGPWSTRNYIVYGQLIPVKGSFWVNVWKGNNDYATGSDRLKLTDAQKRQVAKEASAGETDDVIDGAHQYDMIDPSTRQRLVNHTEAEREEVFKELAKSWIADHPAQYLQLCGIRLAKTLLIDWDNPRAYLSPTYLACRVAILLLTIPGLVMAWRKKWSLALPALLALTALGSYTLTITAARFAFPFEPIQLALVGGLVAMLLPDPDRAAATARGFEPLMDRPVGQAPALSH